MKNLLIVQPALAVFSRWRPTLISVLAFLLASTSAQPAMGQDIVNDGDDPPSQENEPEFDLEFWQEIRDVLELLALTDEQKAEIEQILLENQTERVAARQALALALLELETWDGNIETEADLNAQLVTAITESSIISRDTKNAIWDVLTLQQRITFGALEILVRAQITALWEAYEPPTPDERRERRAKGREAYLARMDAFREFLNETYPDFAAILEILRGHIEASPAVQALKERIDAARLTDEQKDAINVIFTDSQPVVQEVREAVLSGLVDLYDGVMDSADDVSIEETATDLTAALIDQRLVQLETVDQIMMVLTDDQLALIIAWREWWDTRKDSRPLGEGWRVGRLGLYNDQNAPWVYHAYLGWLYMDTLGQMEGENEAVWIFHRRTGQWYYSLEDVLPYLYSVAEEAWYYLQDGWIYNFDTGAWKPAS